MSGKDIGALLTLVVLVWMAWSIWDDICKPFD